MRNVRTKTRLPVSGNAAATDGRLLTLTGTGGCGKTRVALELAAGLLPTFPDGVWLVELAPLADAELVPQAVILAFGVREQSGEPLLATLTRALATDQVLLVFDNCEHVIEVCAGRRTSARPLPTPARAGHQSRSRCGLRAS